MIFSFLNVKLVLKNWLWARNFKEVIAEALGTRACSSPYVHWGFSELYGVTYRKHTKIMHIAIAIVRNQSVNLLLFLFAEMWYQIFLWCLATSVFIHCVSAGVAFFALRQHSRGMFFPLLIIFVGFLYPVTGGIVTSELNF